MSSRIDAVPAATGRDWLTVLAVVALVVAFGVAAGLLGLLAGLATAAIAYVLGLPYALAAGHVALIVTVPDGIDPFTLVLVEAAFMAVLLAPVRRTASPGRIALVAVTSVLALAGTAWLVVGSQSLWLAATTLLALLALTAYGIHRLALVRLGLVPTDSSGDDSPLIHGESSDGPMTTPSAETATESAAEPTSDSHTDR